MKINLCGIDVDGYSFDEVINIIVNYLKEVSEPKYVVTPNAQHLVILQKDAYFRKIYGEAFLSVPDGVSLLWAAKFLGTPLKDRVNGTDLFERLCAVSAEKGFRVFLLGGRPGKSRSLAAADAAASILQKRYRSLHIVGTYSPPYDFENDDVELQSINSIIKAASPDILFVGLGAPKQEKWIYENYQELGVPISAGIGVSFELVSGMVKRAPKFMQKSGLEWFFRLLMEPSRLWKRYVVCNTKFVCLVIRQRLELLNFP